MGKLVLTRRKGQSFDLLGLGKITVLDCRGYAKILIDLDESIRVLRSEIYQRDETERKAE